MMMMMLFSLLDEIEIDLSFVKIRIFFTFGEKIFAKIEWKDTSKKSWVGLGTSGGSARAVFLLVSKNPTGSKNNSLSE